MMIPPKKNSQTLSFTAQAKLIRKLATEQVVLTRETLALITELTATLREWQKYAAVVGKPVLVEAYKTKAKVTPCPVHRVERPSKATLADD